MRKQEVMTVRRHQMRRRRKRVSLMMMMLLHRSHVVVLFHRRRRWQNAIHAAKGATAAASVSAVAAPASAIGFDVARRTGIAARKETHAAFASFSPISASFVDSSDRDGERWNHESTAIGALPTAAIVVHASTSAASASASDFGVEMKVVGSGGGGEDRVGSGSQTLLNVLEGRMMEPRLVRRNA